MPDRRDLEIIKKIKKYCDSIERLKGSFAQTQNVFEGEEIYQAASGMFIIQIGELAKNLSSEFISSYPEIPWHQIKGLRNIYAHEYHNVDKDMIWETIVYDIPVLSKFCTDLLNNCQNEN